MVFIKSTFYFSTDDSGEDVIPNNDHDSESELSGEEEEYVGLFLDQVTEFVTKVHCALSKCPLNKNASY